MKRNENIFSTLNTIANILACLTEKLTLQKRPYVDVP